MPDAFDHCEALVREADRDRFLATLYAPLKYRRALRALYAFNIEIKRVRERAREPMPGEIRLQWWRDALGGIGRGDVDANPIAAALRDTIVRYRLPPASIVDLIDAHSFDLYDEPITTFAQLDSYAKRTSGTMFELAARILAGELSDSVIAIADNAGRAETITDMLASFPQHAARRQLYLPLEAIEKYGANREDVFAMRVTMEMRMALAEMRLRARGNLARVGGLSGEIPPAVLPALLPLAPLRPFLLRMERRSYNPFRPPLPSLLGRQWHIWQAAKVPWRIGGG